MTSLWTNKADKVVDLYHICNLLDDHFLFRFRFRVRFRVRFRFRFRPFPLNPLTQIQWKFDITNITRTPVIKRKFGRIMTAWIADLLSYCTDTVFETSKQIPHQSDRVLITFNNYLLSDPFCFLKRYYSAVLCPYI